MGSVTEISQPEALRLQLAMIAGGEPRGSYFELRWRRENSKGMGQDFISVREAPRAARAILNRGQMGDVYVGAAPRARELGTAAAVERLWASGLTATRPKPSNGSEPSGRCRASLSDRAATTTCTLGGRCATRRHQIGRSARTGGLRLRSERTEQPPMRRGSCARLAR
jgi:hypothetical protein